MKNDRRILYALVILIAIVIVLTVVLYINFSKYTFSEEIIKDFSKQRGYSIVKVSNSSNDFFREEFFVVSDSEIILDTKIIEKWNDIGAFNKRYNGLNNLSLLIYNVEKTDDSITYNTTINNGKNIAEIISIKEKSSDNTIVRF